MENRSDCRICAALDIAYGLLVRALRDRMITKNKHVERLEKAICVDPVVHRIIGLCHSL